jgi:glycosyltransferase involved in cell wall biosynthesis
MRRPDPAVVVIEGSDFETFPVGGQLAVARSLMKIFGSRLALVGMSRSEWPIGRWTEREISGTPYLFFSVCHREPSAEKPFVPVRLTFYRALRRFKKQILSLGCRSAFIQAPEALLAVSHWNWESLCYRFAGVENPLNVSRYPFVRPFRPLLDKFIFSALNRADLILATADQDAINTLAARSNGQLAGDRLMQMPTCVDSCLFHPVPLQDARAKLGLPENCRVFVNSGRIGRFKGWELVLDAFEVFLRRNHNALLFFVGDGEDRCLLQAQIDERNLGLQVKITGFQKPSEVAAYLNAADVFVCGSLKEGWSVAMLEALACGKAIVSTEVSGTAAMIKPGENGFILQDRDPLKFAEAMENALRLADAEQVSTSTAASFDLTRMGERLARVWAPFRGGEFREDGREAERSEAGSLD